MEFMAKIDEMLHQSAACKSICQVFILLLATNLFSVAMSLSQRPCALITGSTDGIGLTTAKNLAKQGYNILIHGRSEERIERAQSAVREFCDDDDKSSRVFTLPPADLSSVASTIQLARDAVQVCKQENLHLAIIMNNAGVFASDLVLTDDDLELTFAVNVVAPFVLTSLLLPTLLEQQDHDRRIVIASSISQSQKIYDWNDLQYSHHPYSAHSSYSESKLLDAMLTMEFARRLDKMDKKVTCNCLDPGTVNTKMLMAGWGPCGIRVEDALDESWLCTSQEVQGVSGRYFVNRRDCKASAAAYDVKQRETLWSMLTKIAPEAAAIWEQRA
ncbi:hypothetical protein MPSEU_000629900 [Mayamaea pseudoterrestris]|nr:hypothetical protein MPSEU_000629900 [Mayamaea pseudoterrestris]